jgi:hypothetical protein
LSQPVPLTRKEHEVSVESAGLNRRHAGLGNAVVSSKGEDRDVILEFFVIWRKTPNFIERIYSFRPSEDLDSGVLEL